MHKVQYAWGVLGDMPVGIYWWFEGAPRVIPAHVSGYTTATFKTRQQARDAAAWENNHGWPGKTRYRVVKLRITTEVI